MLSGIVNCKDVKVREALKTNILYPLAIFNILKIERKYVALYLRREFKKVIWKGT